MISPTFRQFKKLAKKGNVIAICSEIRSDLETPVSAFLSLARKEPCAFLLESAEQEEKIGRYSFLGFAPSLVVTSRDNDVFIKAKGRNTKLIKEGEILAVLRGILENLRLANPEGLPNFAGGFVGFLGYENVKLFEQVRLREKNGLAFDDAVFFLVKDLVLFDHFRKTLSIISLREVGNRRESVLRKEYSNGLANIRKIQAKLRKEFHRRKAYPEEEFKIHLASNFSPRQFEKRVERIKEYIRAGDCIQVVFSQRFSTLWKGDDFEIYRSLRSINPSPYMFYFRHGSLRLIGSSPELLVKKSGREAEVRPIAGTRPRGITAVDDQKLEENLRRSVKEMAEHLMLVDLGRNDLGRVCEFKSVQVKDFARVERYSHVMHLVSDVVGRLKRNRDAFDLLKATFPAGTVTGAPKIRAMEIIDELEPEKRGPYAGCLGYFSFNGDMDMCITIRTIMILGKELYIQAGAGIVHDSKPRKEFEETLNKAKALFQALKREQG